MLTKNNWKHIKRWTLFLLIEWTLAFIAYPGQSWWQMALFQIPEIFLFYSLLYLLLRYGAATQVEWPLVSRLFLTLVLFLAVILSMRLTIDHYSGGGNATLIQYSAMVTYRWWYFFILCMTYHLMNQQNIQQKRVHELEMRDKERELLLAKREADLFRKDNALLQAQIRPHLLINTLSMLKSKLILNDEASEIVTLYGDVMHFAISSEEEDGLVGIDKEWKYIQKYLRLQELRFGGNVQVDFEVTMEDEANRVPPLVLFSLVENVYKYGLLTDATRPARIRVTSTSEGWSVDLRNFKRQHAGESKRTMGVANSDARLAAAYGPQGYRLTIEDLQDTYSLHLVVARPQN